MADQNDNLEPPSALVLTHVLEKMRARDGLTLLRLQNDRGQAAAPLFQLRSSQRFANVHEVDLPAAVHSVVSQCVLEAIDGTHRIVADAILALGLFSEQYGTYGIDEQVISALRADSLGTRRRALLANWRSLHDSIGLPVTEAPSDRTLRGTTESEVLRELSRQLIQREVNTLGSRSVDMPAFSELANSTRPKGRVIVVGGAVMDATFRTKTMPQSETSSEAYGFDLSPGGKGVSQAVAAARLGLEVYLIAAVAGDRFGQEIIHYLRDEGVNTSLLKVVHQARTPFTGVIEMELGDSIAVNWRNQTEIRLEMHDVEQLSPELTACDAVLVTFEIPRETVQRTLELVHDASDRPRPLVIVTPGQPYPDDDISRRSLAQIDYMVAHAWELGRYSRPGQERFDPDPVARHLLADGVGTLCIPGNGGCTIYSGTPLETFSVPSFPSIYKESSAARDAFCAALAAQLIDNDRVFSEQQALWATAAMACATADFPLSNSMPDHRRVEALLSRCRFTGEPPS